MLASRQENTSIASWNPQGRLGYRLKSTIFTNYEPTTSISYYKTCKKEMDPESEEYIQDIGSIYDEN